MTYPSDQTDISLHIRWTEGADLSFTVDPYLDTPATLKDLVMSLQEQGRKCRRNNNDRLTRLVYMLVV